MYTCRECDKELKRDIQSFIQNIASKTVSDVVQMKTKLYNTIMDYYSKQENFEYCTQLSQSLNKINDETNN